MPIENPLFQPRLVVVERQVPVLRLANDGLGAADGAVGIDEFHGAEVASALLTLVAIGPGVMTMGTFTHDIAVGQELMSLLIVVLFCFLLYEFALVVQLLKEVAGQLAVGGAGGTAIHVERNAEFLERLFNHRMVAVDHVLDRKSTRLNSSHANISYAVFCLKKKKL